jgi:hypothetical protein
MEDSGTGWEGARTAPCWVEVEASSWVDILEGWKGELRRKGQGLEGGLERVQ